MKLLQVLAALSLLALATAGTATAREIRAGGPVRALGTTGVEVAFVAEVRPRCFEVRVWDTGDRGVRRYARQCFPATSTGSGVAAVAVANRRVLWLSYTGGNIREWSLWTRTRTSQAKRIRFVSAPVDGPAPIVLGTAWNGFLPYAVGRTVVVLNANGSRRFALEAPDRVLSVSAHTRGFAALLVNGDVLTISSTGRALRQHAFAQRAVEAAVLAGPGLVVKRPRALEIRNGDSIRRLSLPAGSRFLGFSDGILAYASGTELRLLRIGVGSDALFRRLPRGFLGQLGVRGLGSAAGARVSFDAWSAVSAGAGR